MAQANSSIATAPSCSTLLRKPLKLEELGKWIQSGALEYLPSPKFSKGRTQAFGWSRKGTRLGTAPRIEERIIRLTLQSEPMLIPLPNFKRCWGPACGGGKSRFPSLVGCQEYSIYKLYKCMLVPKMKTVQRLSTRRTQAGCFYGGFRMS